MFKDIFQRSGILPYLANLPIRKAATGELAQIVLEARMRRLDDLKDQLASKKAELAKALKAAEIFDAETIARGRRLQSTTDRARAEYHRACDSMNAEQLAREDLRAPLGDRIARLKADIRGIEFGDPLAAVYDWTATPGAEPSKSYQPIALDEVLSLFPPASHFETFAPGENKATAWSVLPEK